MLASFDIFRKDKDGVQWCGEARTLAEANAKVKRLNNDNSEFVIFNQKTQESITVKSSAQSVQP